jgi:aconitate hydratase
MQSAHSTHWRFDAISKRLTHLPWIHRILVENIVRTDPAAAESILPDWIANGGSDAEIAFYPRRIMMHDTTCGPALVDIAAARSALAERGGDPRRLSPVLPVDVSTDHSIAMDQFGVPDALARNLAQEMARNEERYRFMKWATRALGNVTVHPPGTGIMHTINLERLATVVSEIDRDGYAERIPDTLIGTDSHTPMVNGIGVLGWGVGGLEAEAVMMGVPVMMRVPRVVGVCLSGHLRTGVLATDLALHVTHVLRGRRLDNRFVEFFGSGVATLSAGTRAVVANMAPEFGGATGYFPIDQATLDYLAATGRSPAHVAMVRDYAQANALWFDPQARPVYEETIEIDLAEVATGLAGPRRPQDLVMPAEVPGSLPDDASAARELPDGAVAIAAITSCTNTSDPALLIAAGLLARKARVLGLTVPHWVKTVLAPGSPTAGRYLERAGLLGDLEALGFAIAGYGCAVCIGNSGALTPPVQAAIDRGAHPVAVISGNRNFPGRIHPALDRGFLASPPLVIAFAIAGDVKRDIMTDPIGVDRGGKAVHLADLWPSEAEIAHALRDAANVADYDTAYAAAARNPAWAAIDAPESALYPWDPTSTYLRRPPFATAEGRRNLERYLAHPLIVLGDDITTDHISPAGAIPTGSAAAHWLVAHGEDPADLNVFSSRRGNWEVMLRGLFTNRTVRNLLGDAIPPGATVHAPSAETLPLSDAAERYRRDGASVVIVAGERYGMGSSRDWAAKGAALLGVRAVLASSFERIHRSNLINMGIVPLRLPADRHPTMLQLAPGDTIELDATSMVPRAAIAVTLHRRNGTDESFTVMAEVETALEVAVLRSGGIIPKILEGATAEIVM